MWAHTRFKEFTTFEFFFRLSVLFGAYVAGKPLILLSTSDLFEAPKEP